MDETILRHLARTEAMLEAVIASNAVIFHKSLNMTPEEAEKHFLTTVDQRTNEILARMVRDLK